MSIKTAEKDPKEIREELKKFHQKKFDDNRIIDPVFIPKMAYKPSGKNELFIAFFPSELKKGVDLYTEFTSRDFTPEDPERKLYKWKYNPHYDTEYEKVPNKDGNDHRYLIPVEELVVVTEKAGFELPDPETDLPLDRLTIRDVAAIFLNKPVSKKQWLNDIINER